MGFTADTSEALVKHRIKPVTVMSPTLDPGNRSSARALLMAKTPFEQNAMVNCSIIGASMCVFSEVPYPHTATMERPMVH